MARSGFQGSNARGLSAGTGLREISNAICLPACTGTGSILENAGSPALSKHVDTLQGDISLNGLLGNGGAAFNPAGDLIGVGNGDMVAGYGKDLSLLWQQIEDPLHPIGRQVRVDALGRIVTAADAQEYVAVLSQRDEAGLPIWSTPFNPPGAVWGRAGQLEMGGDGTLVSSGLCAEDMGGPPGLHWVSAFSPDGNLLWFDKFNANNEEDYTCGIAFAAAGEVWSCHSQGWGSGTVHRYAAGGQPIGQFDEIACEGVVPPLFKIRSGLPGTIYALARDFTYPLANNPIRLFAIAPK